MSNYLCQVHFGKPTPSDPVFLYESAAEAAFKKYLVEARRRGQEVSAWDQKHWKSKIFIPGFCTHPAQEELFIYEYVTGSYYKHFYASLEEARERVKKMRDVVTSYPYGGFAVMADEPDRFTILPTNHVKPQPVTWWVNTIRVNMGL
jgi:hypothetical protein